MRNFLSVDSLLYKVCTFLYNFVVLNLLWLFFSIPFITIGSSTTALFYVTDKIIKNKGESSLLKSFWHSFKINFKTANIAWIIILLIYTVIINNIRNIHLIGEIGKYIIFIQIGILIELIIITIYIFPLIAKYHIKVRDAFKAAFFISNQHLFTSILCLAIIPFIYYLLIWKEFFILFIISIYSYGISYLLKDKLIKYANTNK